MRVRRTIDRIGRAAIAAALVVPIAAPAADSAVPIRPHVPAWPDTPLARIEVLALLQSLNAALLSHDSATLTLDDWCQRHHLAAPGSRIVAERVTGQDKPATTALRDLLQVGAGGAGTEVPIRYRRVRLRCGAHILSEADNWYVPSRLTPAMNTALDTSDIAFGRAVQPLHFHRQTLAARLLWSPLPSGWDEGGASLPPGSGDPLPIPPQLIEHRAILSLPDGTPFSAVTETYTDAVLAFAPPMIGR